MQSGFDRRRNLEELPRLPFVSSVFGKKGFNCSHETHQYPIGKVTFLAAGAVSPAT